MAGYLDNYGAGDAKRERIIKGLVIAVLIIATASGALFLFLRDYQEKRLLSTFLDDLNRKDFPTAYTRWGCSTATPCKDYNFQKFMKDWGPDSAAAKNGSITVVNTRVIPLFSWPQNSVKSCDDTVIQIWSLGGKEDITLLVNRKAQIIGFAPWSVCNPHMKMP